MERFIAPMATWEIVGGDLPPVRVRARTFDEALAKARLRDPGYCAGWVVEEGKTMMLSMTETDYENWRDGLRCGGQEEYGTQYTAASLYEGGWRADALPDLIEQFNLTSDEAERIYNELLDLEQKAKSEETEA